MGRTAKERRPRAPKPVERIDLEEKHFGRRLVAFLACLAVAITALGYGIYAMIATEPGWVTVEANVGSTHCGADFVFRYYLDGNGMSATDELRQVRLLYNDLAVKAYQLFTPVEAIEGVHNLCYINAHPNEKIQVDPVLYQAFGAAAGSGDRSVFLGPVYAQYSDLLYCQEDVDAYYFDPYENPEAREFCQELVGYAASPQAVDVELLGDNTLRLRVSEDYLGYAQEQGGLRFLDFSWQTNAYIIDYFAQSFQEHGLTSGDISSVDGYSRSLFQEEGRSVLTLYAWEGGRDVEAARAELPAGESLVNLRAFPTGNAEGRYYVMENGSIRHRYASLSDGLCRSSVEALTLYSTEKDCVQLMLEAGPLFIAERLDDQALSVLAEEGVHSIAVRDRELLHSDPELPLEQLYKGYQARTLGQLPSNPPGRERSKGSWL